MECCLYYQAHVKKSEAWFVTALLRSCEHIAFDRTIDVEKSIFEFFVPAATEPYFIEIMDLFLKRGSIDSLQKLPNRLCD